MMHELTCTNCAASAQAEIALLCLRHEQEVKALRGEVEEAKAENRAMGARIKLLEAEEKRLTERVRKAEADAD